ncbi:ABC transporter permease [Actinospica sp. MGRD01-02]|uniref:ABC transporter permease n=1 Tax=Actinospica acidithermotolerans TaxID=2828514 RepID=A0A941IHM4_9ACTN|nr:ABC transporter permease [Actinospica acidithermotolerans]MBR7825328.1 ABC transporter permease [Actinospica acidithermotolerans]
MYNSTVAWISFRALFGRRRALLFVLPALVLIVITLVLKNAHGTQSDWPALVLGRVGVGAVVPLTALLVGTSVLGSEIDDNSVLHLLATPVPRRDVVVSKIAVSAATTTLFAAVPVLIAGIIAQGPHKLAFGCFLGAVLGSIVYSCLFVLISAALRHPVIYALAYVAIWEQLIATLVGGAKYLSIEQWSLGIAHSVSNSGDLDSHLTFTPSIVLSVIAVAVTAWYASERLSAFTVRAN